MTGVIQHPTEVISITGRKDMVYSVGYTIPELSGFLLLILMFTYTILAFSNNGSCKFR